MLRSVPETMYSCVACGHIYHQIVSQCDCLENPENEYKVCIVYITDEIVTEEDFE